ncbi:MAG: hypothetical protein COA29_02240 [Porticoccus sp.]|nr:MAG: hypothetical protein COA29_02240 [Porticoccus sp.]
MNLDECDKIFDLTKTSKTEAEFCYHITPLFETYNILSIGLGRGNIFWRARTIERSPWPNVFDLDYPPPTIAKRGRLNDEGSPCFYISQGIETALQEIEAQEGQIIQVAGFRNLSDQMLRLIIIGEYSHVQKRGFMNLTGTDPNRAISRLINNKVKNPLSLLYIDRFLSNIIGDPDARKTKYIFSRALGEFLHSQVDADGIAFPSTRDPGGFNLAIKPTPSDRVFHNVACLLIKVGKKRSFHVLDHEIINSAVKIDDELNFIWPEKYQNGQFNVYGMTKEEYEFTRNRTNKDAIYDMLSMHSSQNR